MKTENHFTLLTSLLAGLLNILAFGIYNWQTFNGVAHPNIASWAVWGFMSFLNFTSYSAMSKDWVKSLLPTISSIQCILTFFLTLFHGQLKELSLADTGALIVGIVASVLWWKYQETDKDQASMMTNLTLQIGITIGFVPTFQSTWVQPQREMPLPWFIWTISFALQIIVVILRWKGQKRDLAYPVNCLWLHLVVGLLALR